MARCSSGLKRHVQKLGGGLSVFEAFGNYTEGESLHARDRLITVGTVTHDPGQCGHFGQPPAIIFALKLDGKRHLCTVASGQQSNNQMEPSRLTVLCNPVAAPRGSFGALG